VTRLALVCTLVVAGVTGLATSAGADLPEPGPNGQIAFTSGRGLTNATSQIWLLSSPGGSPTRLTTVDTSHFRHPAWSPDHTKIAYASTTNSAEAFTGPWDIFVRDLTQPLSGTNPVNITNTATAGEERPAWSPDGTRIAYQVGVPNPVTNIDIEVRPATGGSPTKVATSIEAGATNGGSFYNRPHWSPNSTTIYYGVAFGMSFHNIRKSLADGSQQGGVNVIDGTTDDYQPQVSPDGTKLCFTRETGGDKDVFVAPIAGGTGATVGTALVTDNATNDDYECAWSPDQSLIAFTRGAQTAGEVRMGATAAAGTSMLVSDVAGVFDGNPDWAVNFRPVCQDGNASVAFNSFASIPLVCTDREGQGFDPEIVTPPGHGNLGAIDNDRVIYTPNANFQGQDSFTFKNSDGNSDSNVATIHISVGGPGTQAGATVDALTMSPKRWRRGSALPTFSAARVGTTIGVRLSAAGRVTLTFRGARPGRRVHGRCVRPTRRNRTRRRCTRYVRASALSFDGKQGANSVRFQGRLSARKRLALGRYRLSAAVTAGGQTSPSRTVAFRIVRR
jgi:Tol biopolymer transport system component